MGFIKKIWQNRVSAYPNRRLLMPTGETNVYDVSRSEGTVTTEGDAFDADTMNDLESRIGDGFAETDKIPNPNMLANWYLADPVDTQQGYVVPPSTPYYSDTGLATQVGTTSEYVTAKNINGVYGSITVNSTTYYVNWSAAVRGYVGKGETVDGWNSSGNNRVVTIKDGYTQFSDPASNAGTFTWGQTTEHVAALAGKTATFSMLSECSGDLGIAFRLELNGSYAGGNIVVLSSGVTINTFTFPASGFDTVRVGIYNLTGGNGGTIKIEAAKLELGDRQTLAHQDADDNWVLNDPPPDKLIELIKVGDTTNIRKELQAAHGSEMTGTVPADAAGWYRIATSAKGVSRNVGAFSITANLNGGHTSLFAIAGASYAGRPSVTVLHASQYSNSNLAISKIRVVSPSAYSNNYAYLEVYCPKYSTAVTTIKVQALGNQGWTLTAPAFVDATVPEGYTAYETSLNINAMTTSNGIITGGTQDLTVAQVRNITAGTADLEAGVSSLPAGQLYLVYE